MPIEPDLEDNSIDEEIAMGLLWEWWVTTTKALVDVVGSEVALKAMRPYYINANTAAMHISAQMFHERAADPDFAPRMVAFAMEAWTGVEISIFVENDRWEAVMRGCRTGGECRELCQFVCQECIQNSSPIPSCSVEIRRGLSDGDTECLVTSGSAEGIRREKSPNAREFFALDLGEAVTRSFRLQYVGESWVFTTRAFIDCVGSQRALEHLRKYMRHSGMGFGAMWLERIGHEVRPEEVGEMVHRLCSLHGKCGTLAQGTRGTESEVRECPFSQAPSEICLQYEAFFRGVCEAVGLDLDFAYDRMMTAGDESCHWTVGRK